MTESAEPGAALAATVAGSWRRFLETYEPLRPALYRYCRYLTRSPWDAEDLAQDVLARAFATLGQLRAHRGELLLLSWYAHLDGDFVRAVTRVELHEGHIARMWNYFYTPELIADVCNELGLPHRVNGTFRARADA
jgi:hypothetical protein